MAQPALALTSVDQWLEAHSESMYTCPNMPGHPRITLQTCLRRRALANEISKRAGNESLFDGGGPVGITSCLGCPVLEQAKVGRAA